MLYFVVACGRKNDVAAEFTTTGHALHRLGKVIEILKDREDSGFLAAHV